MSHAVFAITEAGDRVRVSEPMTYDEALTVWATYQSDRPRDSREEYGVAFKGRAATWVRHFDVRSTDEHAYAPVATVVERWSRPYASDIYVAKRSLKGTGVIGKGGGWVYDAAGRTVAQGWWQAAVAHGRRFAYVGRDHAVVAPGHRYLIGETRPDLAPVVEHVCRHCRKPIVWATITTPGYKPRTGWSDEHPRDPFTCFRAANYSHKPEETS
jgi:hypothetical protein